MRRTFGWEGSRIESLGYRSSLAGDKCDFLKQKEILGSGERLGASVVA